jgi:outer membrane protein
MKKTTRNKWLVFALLLLGFQSTQAQTEYRLNVKEAVGLALKNVTDIKNLRIDSLKQEAQNKEIVGSALPQVSGSGQIAHYLTAPQVLFPFNGSLQKVSFAQPWNATAGVSLNQLLFQPDVFVGLIARKTSIEYATENIKVQEEKTREQVQKAYYQVLIAEEQLSVLQQSLQRFQKLLSDQEQLFKNGFIEKLDIDKTTVSYNNTKSSETQLKNVIELGYAALKFSMGLNQSDKIVLTEKLSTQTVKENILDDGSFNYNNRSEIRVLNTVQKLQQLDVKRHKLGYLPTLSFFYQFQEQGQRLNKSYAAVSDKNWFWFNSNLIGLNLSVPIFDGFQRKHKIHQAQYTLEKTVNTMENVKKAIDLEKTSAQINLRNAILNMDAQQKNLELAERVYNTTKKKYEQGVGSSFEVLQSDTEFQRAQGNYFDALYNAVVARISYFKAIGQLN